jgi:hypothetical protein
VEIYETPLAKEILRLGMSRGGVLTIAFSGALTYQSLLAIRVDAALRYGARMQASVFDLSSAAIAMSSERLDALAQSRVCSLAHTPCAIVAGPANWNLMASHAMRMARRGIVRQLFSDGAQAMEWALIESALA